MHDSLSAAHAVTGGWDNPADMDWLLLAASFVVILAGAELFTNGVEWVGDGLGLSERAVGSVLAAVGTALPETLLPLVAILFGHGSGDDIGIGAILGAPFMLSTLAMFALGLTVVIFSRMGRRSPRLEHDRGVLAQDLRNFLAMYSLALVAGILHVKWLNVLLGIGLIGGYVRYVRRHFSSPAERELVHESAVEIKPLRIASLMDGTGRPSVQLSALQTALGLGVIVAGAEVFVNAIETLGDELHVSHLVFALLLAPIATELPEALNASVIWARRGKDVLALGNITGAMVFQSTFPVTIGMLLTPWRLDLTAGVAAGISLVAGTILYLTVRRQQLVGSLLLLQGLLYVAFVVFALTRI